MLQFFDSGILLPDINCTLVTLVPKVHHPSLVKDFRPIVCCTVLYKIMILTTRMQSMIGSIIDLAHAIFIPMRAISDNILLATKLIKGYTHKNISHRCMVKIDLKKAYNSIEWSYLETVMNDLGFSTQFVK